MKIFMGGKNIHALIHLIFFYISYCSLMTSIRVQSQPRRQTRDFRGQQQMEESIRGISDTVQQLPCVGLGPGWESRPKTIYERL